MFALPKVKPLNNRKTAKAREGKLKAVINNKQRTAWINVINKGYVDDNACPKDDGTNNVRICMHHFHPSTMDINENGKIVLKIGACPTMHLTYQALTSNTLKENKSLPRFVLTVEEELQLE